MCVREFVLDIGARMISDTHIELIWRGMCKVSFAIVTFYKKCLKQNLKTIFTLYFYVLVIYSGLYNVSSKNHKWIVISKKYFFPIYTIKLYEKLLEVIIITIFFPS